MVFGDWSVLSAAVPSVGHGCPSTFTPAEGKRAPMAPQKDGLGVLGRWQQGPVTTKTDKCQLHFPQNFIERCSVLAGSS